MNRSHVRFVPGQPYTQLTKVRLVSEFPGQLLGDLVVIEMEPEPRTGVILPDWKKSLRGKVLAIGAGLPLQNGGIGPMQCAVGDRVSFGAAKGIESVFSGATVRIMKDTDVDFILPPLDMADLMAQAGKVFS